MYITFSSPKENFNFVGIESSQAFSDFETIHNTLDMSPLLGMKILHILEDLG